MGFKTLMLSVVVAAILILLSGYILMNTDMGLEKQDRDFMDSIKSHLQKIGDGSSAVDILNDGWTDVCPIFPYSRVSKVVAAYKGVSTTDIRIINTNDEVATDALWGFAFIYPDNRVKYFRISEKRYFYAQSKDCVRKNSAYFVLVDTGIKNEIPHLKLIEKK